MVLKIDYYNESYLLLVRSNLKVCVWNSSPLFRSNTPLGYRSRSWTGVTGSGSSGVECQLLVLCPRSVALLGLLHLGLARGGVAGLELGQVLADHVVIVGGQLGVGHWLGRQVGCQGRSRRHVGGDGDVNVRGVHQPGGGQGVVDDAVVLAGAGLGLVVGPGGDRVPVLARQHLTIQGLEDAPISQMYPSLG